MENKDDWQIVQACKTDKKQFDHLVKRHYELVVNISFRILLSSEKAKDAAQEIFLKAYQWIDKLKEDQPFKHWLCKITSNHCINLYNKNQIYYYFHIL